MKKVNFHQNCRLAVMALKGRSAVIAFIKVLRPENANGMTNSRYPDQTALSDLGLPGGYLLLSSGLRS